MHENSCSWQDTSWLSWLPIYWVYQKITVQLIWRCWSFHCKCFSRSCLSVCKNTNIKSIDRCLNKRFYLFKYIRLAIFWKKNLIKIVQTSWYSISIIYELHSLMTEFFNIFHIFLRKIYSRYSRFLSDFTKNWRLDSTKNSHVAF